MSPVEPPPTSASPGDAAVDTAAGSGAGPVSGPPSTSQPLVRGASVGRYVVLGELGAGGMGIVYAAYDPELDRKVALKVLRAERSHGADDRSRLLAEAQALAKLAHPNVVSVHDVGTVDDDIWLAMEFVEGQTLTRWAAGRRRTWREVLAVVTPALHGLAAAHQVGLVHRDIKPDNLMVASDGRVRVMDFGLARAAAVGEVFAGASGDPEIAPQHRALELRLTRAGSLVGTPAYMAPEQFAGWAVDARTDQWSTCAMTWELLFGVRPFRGDSIVELATHVLAGEIIAPPPGTAVPRWLRGVLERGLHVDPAARHPSVGALLDALARGTTRARRAWWLAGASVVALAGIGTLGVRRLGVERNRAQCASASAVIAQAWDDTRRGALRAAMGATGVPHAEATFERAAPFVDAYVARWQSEYTRLCVATVVDGIRSPALWRASEECLEERRGELAGVLDALTAEVDRAVVNRAVTAVAALARLEPCSDDAWLSRHFDEQRGVDEPVGGREALWRAGGRVAAGRYRAALEDAMTVEADAASHDAGRLRLAALLLAGRAADGVGDYDQAERALGTAFDLALASGEIDTARAAAITLVVTTGVRKARADEGLWWGRVASGLTQLLDAEADLLAGALQNNLGNLHDSRGAYDEALRAHQRGVEIKEAVLGLHHPNVAISLTNLANVHYTLAAFGDARALNERAVAIVEHALGPDHPDLAGSLTNLAAVHAALGAQDEAQRLNERALAIWERALGPDHPDVAGALWNLARVHHARGDDDEAERLNQRALAIFERSLGPRHPTVAGALASLARIRFARGAHDEALVLHERALAIREEALGAEHLGVASSLASVAAVHHALGSHAQALSLLQRALRIREKALGARHQDVADTLTEIAKVEQALRDVAGSASSTNGAPGSTTARSSASPRTTGNQ